MAIDTSGIDTICELRRILEQRSLQLALVNPVGNVMEKLHQSETLESLGSYGLYPNSRGSSGRYFSIVESSTINR
ncbi:hypothetical protein CsSME_00007525 [Camellia sinensis var. sinensis]